MGASRRKTKNSMATAARPSSPIQAICIRCASTGLLASMRPAQASRPVEHRLREIAIAENFATWPQVVARSVAKSTISSAEIAVRIAAGMPNQIMPSRDQSRAVR